MLPVSRLEDLNQLQGISDEKLVTLIRASLASLEGGSALAGDTTAEVRRLVEVLAFLFAEASKLQCSETDLKDSLVSFPLQESSKKLLCDAYLASNERIRARLLEGTVRPPHYHDLDWRMDVELASRSLRQQTVPTWLMKLSVKNSDGEVETKMLQTDAINLAHLYEELSMAFSEERTAYAKRIQRNIK